MTNRSSDIPCNPYEDPNSFDNCTEDGPFLGPQGMVVMLPSGCQGLVQMQIIKCVTGFPDFTVDYTFLEVSITPLQNCDVTLEEIDELYTAYVDFYMTEIASVTSCFETFTTLSSYVQMNCVEACYGIAPYDPEGGEQESPIVFIPCSTGAQGCCIERTSWCRSGDQVIQTANIDTTVPGECTGNQEGGACGNTPIGPGCIPDRCN